MGKKPLSAWPWEDLGVFKVRKKENYTVFNFFLSYNLFNTDISFFFMETL